MAEAKRLEYIKEYYFSTKLREIAQRKADGHPIINLGIGSPDLSPDASVLRELSEQALHGNHQYQSYWGLSEFREAIINYYLKAFDVYLEEDQVVPLMGSKEGIMHISFAFLNPGDTVLIPDPGYPTYRSVSHLAQANVVSYSLKGDNGWQPDFNELEELARLKPKIIWINYPHMPSGAKALDGTFQKLLDWVRKNKVILVSDNPYSHILNNKPKSILGFAKPEDQVLELNSLSKSFNMAGWRVGMLSGNADLIKSVMKVKSNMDSGMFYGIQKGAIKALSLSKHWFEKLNKEYEARRKIVWEICETLGLVYQKDDTAGMFVFARILSGENDMDFTDRILYDYDVFLTPGSIFGSNGGGYARISLCANQDDLKEAQNRLK